VDVSTDTDQIVICHITTHNCPYWISSEVKWSERWNMWSDRCTWSYYAFILWTSYRNT